MNRSRFGLTLHLAPGPARQLAHRGSGPAEDGTDLVEAVAEDVVQHERGALGGRQGVEHDLHSPADLIGGHGVALRVARFDLSSCLDPGLGCVASATLAQRVQAQPGDDRRQPGRRVIDVRCVRELHRRVLHHIIGIGIGLGAEDSGCDGGESRALVFEGSQVHVHAMLTCGPAGL